MVRYLLDTNVCLRLANEQASEYPLVVSAVHALLEQGNELMIVPQNLYELWSVATRPVTVNGFGWSPGNARKACDSLTTEFLLLKKTSDVFTNWLELVTKHEVKGKQVHDARLVAAMQAHGLTHLLTLNIKDFERYPEITAVHPEELSHADT